MKTDLDAPAGAEEEPRSTQLSVYIKGTMILGVSDMIKVALRADNNKMDAFFLFAPFYILETH